MPSQVEIRQQITQQIVSALKSNALPPWRRPWAGAGHLPRNAVSNRRYSGVNILLLHLHGRRLGLRSPHYATYNQWRDLGCQVKARPKDVSAGKWGCGIVFYKPVTKVEQGPDEKERAHEYRVLRNFVVFSADQVDGEAAARLRTQHGSVNPEFADYAPAEVAVAATGAEIRLGGDVACYCPPRPDGTGDYIRVPEKGRFKREGDFYGTLLHELAGHWTERRLGWTGTYPEGELRAEMAAAFALAELGVPQSEDLTNHQAYLASWLTAMESDPRFIFRASTEASRAVDYFLAFSRQPDPRTVEAMAV